MRGNMREFHEEQENKTLCERATKSAETRGRITPSKKCDIRTDFQKDRDRITHCKAFRRLMHKTQVFISPERDHYRTRLTHTLETAQIARTVSRALRLNEDLTEAIALGHDLGHTPFGHTGEDALNGLIIGGFRHNEQSVRVVETLENLNLTFEVIDGILNHRTSCKPATAEGRVVQLCDKIAYMNHDVDDAIRAKILEEGELPKEVSETLGRTPASRIDFLVRNLVEHSLKNTEISLSPKIAEILKTFRTFMFERVYANQLHTKERAKIKSMLRLMFDYYMQNPQKLPQEIAKNEIPERATADFIAGMTDRFAQKQFREIFMPAAWEA
ncbi:MAG: deoxyguanosinetriphosphate triphosphohydrolase [Defluviitaleaceae bacterium]|nr:deoxyguanosinetriphosphate triphosphohydrolase [Defluviitaleaceae bacterium]